MAHRAVLGLFGGGSVLALACLPVEPPFPTPQVTTQVEPPSWTTSSTTQFELSSTAGTTTASGTSDASGTSGTSGTPSTENDSGEAGATIAASSAFDSTTTHPFDGSSSTYDASSTSESPVLTETGTVIPPAIEGWWDSRWACRRPFTVTPTGFTGPVENGVVLMRWRPPSPTEAARMRPGGEDLRLLRDDGTALAFEIDEWRSDGESLVWLEVPVLAPGVSTEGWVYFGNPDPPEAPLASPWRSGFYDAVLHLGASLRDSTGDHHGAASSSPTPVSGPIGGARLFRETQPERVVRLSDSESFGFEDGFSVSMWSRVWPGSNAFTRRGILGSTGWGLEAYDPGAAFVAGQALSFRFRHRCNTNDIGCYPDNADQELLWDGSDATVDQWHQVGITFADGEVTLYVDGLAVVSTALRTALASPLHPLSIGVDPGTTRILFGALDEVRFSDDPWSANRFEADYATVAQNFVAFGTTECWSP